MAATIGSVTEGNANAEEIKNNSPDSELYENNKKYLQGSLVKFNNKIYLAKRNVPSDVDLDNPYYWEIFMDATDSKRVDELFEKTGNLDELETESKDNLVAAINEVGSIQPDWAQNDETAKDYIKNRTHWVEEKAVLEETTFTIEESDGMCALGNFPVTLSAGDICTVVYDGKTYTCTVFEFGTDIAGIGCDAFEIAFQKQPDGLYAITIGAYAGEHTISILQTTYHTIPDEFIPWEESPTATSVLYTAQSLTEEQKVQARQNIGAQDLYNCVQTDKENILGDNGSIISNSIGGNSLTIGNGVIEQKNSNQDSVSLGNAKVVFSHDIDGSSSTRGNGTFTMYGRKGEEYFKFNGTNGDVRVSGIATPTLSNDAVNKSYVDLQIANIEIPTVPTNVSAFTNDAGYLTEHQSLADYALKSEIPSPYSLPTASATELGGVKADSAEAADTQPVRIGGDGKLYTAASGDTDISLGLTSASVGQIIKVKAVDESGKPTAWEAANMPSGGGHWETVLDTVWEQDVINPTAFDSETGIFTCAEGELNNLALNTKYVFFQQCKKQGVAYNTILNDDILEVTKLSDTTFSINVTPPTTFVPTNVKFSKGACLAVTDIDAKKIRLTLDGQFRPTATSYDHPFYGINVPYFGNNTGYTQIRNAYQAYQQVTAEVESPYRIVGEILCGFNAPSQNGNFHFKNNSFCCPLIPSKFPEGDSNFSSDGTKIAKLYSTSRPWLGNTNANSESDYLKIISGTKVKLERWVE